MDPKLHFQRFEFKYIISFELEEQIKRRIKPYVARDPFAENCENGIYEVVSLYYDSPRFYYYWQKVDGAKQRKKIRLRTYRNNGKFYNYSFFEIKRKHDAIILKDRFFMHKTDYDKLIENDDFHSTKSIRDQNRKNIIKEFEWEQHSRSVIPKILVTYDREPYLGKYNSNFRITFDKNIKAMENDNLFYRGNDMRDVSGNLTVMEIKFTGTMPFYVNEVIKEFDLRRDTYSKYCHSVNRCRALSPIKFLRAFDNILLSQTRLSDADMARDGILGL